MFVLTMNKNGLKKAAAAVCCAALIGLGALAADGMAGDPAAQAAALGGISKNVKVKSTDDMVTFLLSYGVEADLVSAKVEKVRVPKEWDENFEAFNEVIRQSGLDLAKSRGKTVEKWEFVAPNRSTGQDTAYAILLVRKNKVVGGYILNRPSGEVQPLAQQDTPPEPPAESIAQPTGAGADAVGLTEEERAQISAAGAAAGLSAEQIAAATAAIEAAAAQTGALPTE